jgi:hypothetical protein
MTTTIRASKPSDLVAYLACGVGYWPTGSVVAMFEPSGVGGLMSARLDIGPNMDEALAIVYENAARHRVAVFALYAWTEDTDVLDRLTDYDARLVVQVTGTVEQAHVKEWAHGEVATVDVTTDPAYVHYVSKGQVLGAAEQDLTARTVGATTRVLPVLGPFDTKHAYAAMHRVAVQGVPVAEEDVAYLAGAAVHPEARDAMWGWVRGNSLADSVLDTLTWTARHTVDSNARDQLYGVIAMLVWWHRGNGAEARNIIEATCPTTLGETVLAALKHMVPPSHFPAMDPVEMGWV